MSSKMNIIRLVASAVADRRGNIAIMTALIMPVLLGVGALGVEAGHWFLTKSSLQNAADSAVIAAATDNGSGTYTGQADAMAAHYGFVNGANNVTVTASNNATCPAGVTAPCYSVTVTSMVPLYLSQVLGYQGNAAVGGAKFTALSATSTAGTSAITTNLCILALGTLTTNGSPTANLDGCSVYSGVSSTCNGHDLDADYGLSHGSNNGCGDISKSNVPAVADPYVGLNASVPANTCGGVYAGRSTLPAAVGGVITVCGTLKPTANLTIPAGNTLNIVNGNLDINHVAVTGTNNTIILSGTNGHSHKIVDTGHGGPSGSQLNITAPTTGTWSGVAVFQPNTLTTHSEIDISDAGNVPNWNVKGLFYVPNSNVTFSGSVTQTQCLIMVTNNFTSNGTAKMLSAGCAAAGLSMPTASIAGRGLLVQ